MLVYFLPHAWDGNLASIGAGIYRRDIPGTCESERGQRHGGGPACSASDADRWHCARCRFAIEIGSPPPPILRVDSRATRCGSAGAQALASWRGVGGGDADRRGIEGDCQRPGRYARGELAARGAVARLRYGKRGRAVHNQHLHI